MCLYALFDVLIGFFLALSISNLKTLETRLTGLKYALNVKKKKTTDKGGFSVIFMFYGLRSWAGGMNATPLTLYGLDGYLDFFIRV